MSIAVLKPGLLTTVQDLGRTGFQHLGISVGGAMDSRAHRLANLLAGNDGDAAALEITFGGPTLRFDSPACFALAGAQLRARLNGEPVPNYRPLIARAGDTLAFGAREAGLRAYLAVHGGFDLPRVMGSYSTYLRGGFGGLAGRALRTGDTLKLATPLPATGLDALARRLWEIRIYLPAPLALQPRAALRLIRGAHAVLFTQDAIQSLFSASFTVSADADRMGYRLTGPSLSLIKPTQLLSEATATGSIQVPADGQPIVLMADRQTVGGYAKIGHVASVDLPHVAQRMPGETLRFEEVTVEQAQALDIAREAAFATLHETLAPLRAALAR
ncbi:5-oxoprolinase/urea amidolyase family protein [Pusillimonas sp. TS35]|uniref:5-oxoprolinase subunit C family protein n=1 Tax=Paracandidimonas lactea TaxID=2895524 RepID=UPI0013695B19|nr:biotin-dependent carboxyltransferase family protein [Paracandidimonas lactea]MYN12960.1 5-oxoprolinase/urea amidolyase family protein [Pusillimonas sp. TS35]